MHLTWFRGISLIAAILGAGGTFVLTKSTFGIEPKVGRAFWAEAVNEENPKIEARNKKRALNQAIGLWLLLLAFVLQGVAAFLPDA